MIDFAKIKQQPSWQTIAKELIANAIPLFLILYGLKCILLLQGKMPLSVRGTAYNHLELKLVAGTNAATAGLLYFSLGLFIFLSNGRPPSENRSWLRRIGRALLRWGILGVAVFAFTQMPDHGLPDFETALMLLQFVGFIAGIIALMSFLFAMFQREQVKQDLDELGCQPLHIWWRPMAYWLPWASYWGATGFRVIYSDGDGFIHKGYCFVYRSFLKDWQWGNRRVRWLADVVTGQLPRSETWTGSEVLRSKLKR